MSAGSWHWVQHLAEGIFAAEREITTRAAKPYAWHFKMMMSSAPINSVAVWHDLQFSGCLVSEFGLVIGTPTTHQRNRHCINRGFCTIIDQPLGRCVLCSTTLMAELEAGSCLYQTCTRNAEETLEISAQITRPSTPPRRAGRTDWCRFDGATPIHPGTPTRTSSSESGPIEPISSRDCQRRPSNCTRSSSHRHATSLLSISVREASFNTEGRASDPSGLVSRSWPITGGRPSGAAPAC